MSTAGGKIKYRESTVVLREEVDFNSYSPGKLMFIP